MLFSLSAHFRRCYIPIRGYILIASAQPNAPLTLTNTGQDIHHEKAKYILLPPCFFVLIALVPYVFVSWMFSSFYPGKFFGLNLSSHNLELTVRNEVSSVKPDSRNHRLQLMTSFPNPSQIALAKKWNNCQRWKITMSDLFSGRITEVQETYWSRPASN